MKVYVWVWVYVKVYVCVYVSIGVINSICTAAAAAAAVQVHRAIRGVSQFRETSVQAQEVQMIEVRGGGRG